MRAVTTQPAHLLRIDRLARVAALLVTMGLVGIVCRVGVLKVRPSRPLEKRVESHHGVRRMPARRGSILDRHGRIFAATRVHHRVFVDPGIIEQPGTFAERVAHELGYDPAALAKRLGERWNRRYVVIEHDPPGWRVAVARSMDLRGLAVEPFTRREYPMGVVAGQVIGFVGREGTGLEGLERAYDDAVRAHPGRLRYARDSGGRALWADWSGFRSPVDGRAVRLTLDATIQGIAERELAETCERFDAEAAQMVVLDPRTGEVLAMANYPPFDPNAFAKMSEDVRRNRCVTDVMEPGSTFKPFIWAAATEQGYADPDEVIDCTDIGVYVTPKGRRLRDAHAHGELSWRDVLVKSSNIGMAIVAQRMGAEPLHRAVSAFGFGQRTGSGFPGEVSGIVRPLSQWNHYSVTSVSMGQEVAATPLQMAAGFAAFANGGLQVAPTLTLGGVPGGGGAEVLAAEPIYRRAIRAETADLVRQVLRRVVEEGTGRKAKSKMYTVFGKTGTAQVANPEGKGYLPGQYVSSFIGGAPYDDPQLVVACMVHKPDRSKGYYGGTVAAPAVRRVIERSLAYMGVPPDGREPEAPVPTRLASIH